jgi:hypothetical protein
MFVAGHAGNVVRTSAFTVGQLTANPWVLGELLFPDAVSCHDTGYAAVLRETEGEGPGKRPTLPALMAQHLLGDAYLHYGDDVAAMRRVGWAYRWLGLLAHRMGPFYARAEAAGCLHAAPRDSVRGWGHTVAEYCLDHVQVGSSRYFGPEDHLAFDGAFTALAAVDDIGEVVDATLARYQLRAQKPVPAQPRRYYRVCAQLGFERVHLGAFALKFGLDLSASALALVEEELEWFLDQVGVDEVHAIVAQLDSAVGDWMAARV